MLKRIASLAIGLFLASQLGSAAFAETIKTHLKVIIVVVEKQTTACFRNANIFWNIFNLDNQFFSGTSTEELNCANGKCTATVHAYLKIPNSNPDAKIGVTASVLSNCLRKYTSDERKTVNAPAQTAGLGGASLDQGGVQTLKINSEISDIRLKRDIAQVGRLANGLTLYRYRYLWSDIAYVGVMAQEVAAVMPAAVLRGADGYLRVDYARLGTRLMTFDAWSARRALLARAQ